MKKVIRIISWLLLNFAMMAILILASFFHHQWAYNIFIFLFWVNVILTILVCLSKDVKPKIEAKGRSVPQWLSNSYDMIFVMILAYHAWFILATVCLVQALCENYLYHKTDNNIKT